MFTKVSFQNLRCFKNFTLENLTPITLISGRNNVGKTTVLEGIFLLLKYRSASSLQVVSMLRGLNQFLNSPYLWETLFTQMDVDMQVLRLSATNEQAVAREVRFEKDTQFSLADFPAGSDASSFLQMQPDSYVLKIVATSHPGEEIEETRRMVPNHAGATVNIDSPLSLPPMPFALYSGLLNANTSPQFMAECLGKVEIGNKKEQLVRSIQLLHDGIADVFPVSISGTVSLFARLGSGEALPLRTMGDGINKLLYYLSAMIANPGGVFLFDEIETGFHHLFYPKLWELIARVAKETGSQVFATTHSYECIDAAIGGVSEVDSSLLTYVRLGKEKEGIVPYSFPHDDLAFALDRNMEVR